MGQSKTWIAHNSLFLWQASWKRFAHLSLPCAPAMQQCYRLRDETSGGVWEEGLGDEEGRGAAKRTGEKINEGGGRKETC